MRSVYSCVICGVHYLPPETMEYPALGLAASPVHCARPECAAAVKAGDAGLPVEVLTMLAMRAADAQGEAREPTRGGGKARGRRAGAAPGGGRSKLR
jgi:hypothetical protein